ncbi:MAG: alpha/beta fold hydrolase [Candidatus Limnocylindrales bacterium]
MPLVHANGIDVHYTAEGTGPPLVLLHGASSSALEDWSAQRPLFRKVFRLYLVDLRGHAGTRGEIGPHLDLDDLAADLLATVDALGLSTFHLAGFSLGGLTALHFALRHAARLRTLILVGVDPQLEPRASVARVLMDPDRIAAREPAWAEQLERRHAAVHGPGAWRELLRSIQAGIRSETALTPAELRGVHVPTLVVCGDRDVFVPPDHAVAFYRQLPDARLCIVPDCGHQAMVLRPRLFSDAAEQFYRSTASMAAERATSGPVHRVSGSLPRRAPLPGAMLRSDVGAGTGASFPVGSSPVAHRPHPPHPERGGPS